MNIKIKMNGIVKGNLWKILQEKKQLLEITEKNQFYYLFVYFNC